MSLLSAMKQRVDAIKNWFLHISLWKKILILIVVIGVGWFIVSKLSSQNQQPEYQTAQAEKGTLVISVSASGQVAASNSTSITTNVTGVVKNVYVKNGQKVQVGDKIAEIDLDQAGLQKQQNAWANYLQAKTSLESAKTSLYTLQAAMFTNWQTYMDTAQNTTFQNSDGSPNTTNRVQTQFTIPQDQWLAAEKQYANQQTAIAQVESALSSAWLSYQQSSATITAPLSGTVDGLLLQEGTIVAQANASSTSNSSTSNSSSTSSNGQKVGTIKTDGNPVISVNLSEVDAPRVKIGDSVTVTLDAFSGKTYAGKVVSIDTTGSVSSGVTTYPVSIRLDTKSSDIYANMSASANIITQTKDDVILVPNAAIQTVNNETTARVLRNNVLVNVPVEIGLANDTQTEIVSGIAEGDTVVTSVTTTQTTTTQSSSPFGGGLRTSGFGGATTRGR